MENTQNITIKRLAALLVAVFVVVVLAVPSFAYTDTSTNGVDFTGQPVPNYDSSTGWANAYTVLMNAGNSSYGETHIGTRDTPDVSVYAFLYLDGNQYYLCEVSDSSFRGCFSFPINNGYSGFQSAASFDSTNNCYVYTASWDTTANINLSSILIPVFPTKADGISAVRDWIANPPVTSQPLSLSLQPGNVAYIDITNTNATITLTQHTSIAYWQLTSTQYIGASNSLPSSGFTVPIAGTGMIDWVGVGRKTVQGQYNDWTSTQVISGSASDHQHVYAIVVNPLQNNVTTGSGLDVSSVANGIINISVDPAWSVKIYQLENQFSLGVDSNTQSGDTGTGTYDPNTGQWTYTNDQTGESFDQQYGGMTTPESQFDSIHDFLENIANTISGFFSGAINAVSTLVGAGSSFFGVLGGLYSWLPPAVYSVLVSALIIVITIGVIKVFV